MGWHGDIDELAKAITKDLKPDLNAELDRLGLESEALRKRVEDLLDLMAKIAMAELTGQDTTLAKQAAKSSAQSIKAAGAITAVSAARTILMEVVSKAFGIVLSAV